MLVINAIIVNNIYGTIYYQLRLNTLPTSQRGKEKPPVERSGSTAETNYGVG
jgi:hypothetical protein